MTMLRSLFVLCCVVTLASCNRAAHDNRIISEVDSLQSKKYSEWGATDSASAQPIKSGIIHMVSTQPIHGSDVERTIYFDDYGRKRCTETVTKIKLPDQTVSTTQVTIDADGMSYKFDPEKKTGVKSKVSPGFNPTQIDFSRVDKMTMENFGIRKEGTETVAGKTCTVYSIDYGNMNFKGRYAVWNNLPLHEQSSTGDFGYEYIATKLEENAPVTPDKFVPPSDVAFQDASMPRGTDKDSLPLPNVQTLQH